MTKRTIPDRRAGFRLWEGRAFRAMRRNTIFALVIFCNFFGASHPVSAQTVKAGILSNLFYLPFVVGQRKGFFVAEGLQVELINIGRVDIQLQALASRELQFANINADGIILFNEKGGNLKIIGSAGNAAPYFLVSGKAYKKIEDLKGAKLGVSSLRGGAASILLSYLKSKGLFYPRDFTLVVITGGTAARLSALESGAIAASVLGIPQADMAIDKGLNKLGDTMDVISEYEYTAISVNPAWAEKNRSTAVKFLKGVIRSLRWIHEQPDQAAEFFSKEMAVEPRYATRGLEYMNKNSVFPRDGSVTLQGLKMNIEVQAKDGFLKEPLPAPEKYLDLSYLNQAHKELGM